MAYHNDAFHSANNARTRCASIVGGSALTRDFASIISRASQRLSIDVVVIEAACCDAKGAREEIKNKEKQNHQTQKNNSQKKMRYQAKRDYGKNIRRKKNTNRDKIT